MKSIRIFLLIIFASANVSAQSTIDVSSLPKANYTERYSCIDRWGAMVGNVIEVDVRLNEEGKITFSTTFIETSLEKNKSTYILFPSSGTETDIFIYKLLSYGDNGFDADDTVLKKKIFMWGRENQERAIQIDDLAPGYYYVDYISCNYGGGYVLHITEKPNPAP